MNAVWTRQNGAEEPISDMQENHLANAYAKSVRDGVNPKARPFLASEILARGVEALVPDSLRKRLNADANVFAY